MLSIDLPNITSVQTIPDFHSGIVIDGSDEFSMFMMSPSKYYFVRGKSILKPKRNYTRTIHRYIDENRPIIL